MGVLSSSSTPLGPPPCAGQQNRRCCRWSGSFRVLDHQKRSKGRTPPPTAPRIQLPPENQVTRFQPDPCQRKTPPGSTFLRIAQRVSDELHDVRSYLLVLR